MRNLHLHEGYYVILINWCFIWEVDHVSGCYNIRCILVAKFYTFTSWMSETVQNYLNITEMILEDE